MNFDWLSLRDQCITYVARDITRSRVSAAQDPHLLWSAAAHDARPEAEAKIAAMTNLELLDLVGWVINQSQ